MAEWLKATDCKSVLFGVRGFESLSHNMEKGMIIILKPISKHGKDRVHQFGNRWIIDNIVDRVVFDNRVGPWLGLRDADGKGDFRWVKFKEDKNFEVVL